MAFGDQTDPFLIKENDTLPQLLYTVQQGPDESKTAVDLSTASSVVFNMRLADDPDTVVVSREDADIVAPAVAGQVLYTFDASDTAEPGDYIGEFEIAFASGVLTAPTGANWIYIKIGDDIA